MSIKLKLVLFTITYTVIFLLIFWYENATLKMFNNFEKKTHEIQELKIQMLTLRRNEKDFLLRQELKYVDRFKQNTLKLHKNIHHLEEFLTKKNINTLKLKRFERYIKDYEKYFLILVEQYKLNGLDNEKGLIKSFNDSMELLIELEDEKNYDDILKLRLAQKSFILSEDFKYIDDYIVQYEKLLSKLPEDSKVHLENYNRDFMKFIDGKVLIGLNENIGIKGDMRSSVHKTEVLLDEMLIEFSKIIETKLSKIKNIRLAIFISLLIFTIYILSSQLYGITNSILRLQKGLDRFFRYLNKEEKNIELLEITSSDEIGKMSKAINDNILSTSKRLEKERQRFEEELRAKTKALQELNNDLEQKVKEEVDKNFKKQLQLFEQSKMASLGSMLGNIIHQWRQPLAQISMLASAIKLKISIDAIDNKKLESEMSSILDKVKYMNEVLVTFRSFVMEKKEKKKVILQDRIDRSLDIVGVGLKDRYIKLKKSIDYENPINITLVSGELSEVIINIINNAKDALVENKIKDPWVKVELKKQKKKAIIIIEDNGGGIPKDVLPHIFEEHFTTKDESIGTGIGLYMSHEIITKSLDGKLYCKNTKNGAKFFIELPLKK